MPIKINLLAEAIAAEEERRRDPVKRGTYVAGLLVLCVVFWAAMLQLKVMSAKSALGALESKWKLIEKSYQATADAQKASIEAEQRLAALHELSTNRFLWGNALNAFQQTLSGVEGVQMLKLKTEQNYMIIDGTPARTNDTKVIQGKPPTSTERISMTIEAMDTSAGRRVNQFKEAIANVPFFKESLNKTNGVMLLSRSAPQASANGNSTFVTFSLKATFPEKTR
jgi:hypothetical protein